MSGPGPNLTSSPRRGEYWFIYGEGGARRGGGGVEYWCTYGDRGAQRPVIKSGLQESERRGFRSRRFRGLKVWGWSTMGGGGGDCATPGVRTLNPKA